MAFRLWAWLLLSGTATAMTILFLYFASDSCLFLTKGQVLAAQLSAGWLIGVALFQCATVLLGRRDD